MYLVETGRKLNVLCTFNLRPVSTCKWRKTELTTFTGWHTCAGVKLTFTGTGSTDTTELQKRWLHFVETLKTRSDTNDLDKECVWLGPNSSLETPEATGRSSLVELERWLVID